MELMLRCAVPDRPGALATLAGAIAEAGGDIQAIDVVESADGMALDDLLVVVEPDALRTLVDHVRAVDDVALVHAGPSRGHPGDAVTRVALGLESLLNGAMTLEHGVGVLVGGLLRASVAALQHVDDAPEEGDRVLVLPFDGQALVVRRDYRFTATERQRAPALLRACVEAGRATRAAAPR